jgi:hypothetical protein
MTLKPVRVKDDADVLEVLHKALLSSAAENSS